MTIPIPALLAMMALLLWPAARLSVVLLEPAERRRAGKRRLASTRLGMQGYLIAATVLATNFLVFIVFLAAITLIAAACRQFWGEGILLFGGVSLAKMFEFIMLLLFAAFIAQSAIETRRSVRDHAGRMPKLDFVRLAKTASERLRVEVPVYVSTVAFSAVLFLIVAGLFSRVLAGIPA